MRIIAIQNTWCKPILFAVSLQFVKLIIITGIFKKFVFIFKPMSKLTLKYREAIRFVLTIDLKHNFISSNLIGTGNYVNNMIIGMLYNFHLEFRD